MTHGQLWYRTGVDPIKFRYMLVIPWKRDWWHSGLDIYSIQHYWVDDIDILYWSKVSIIDECVFYTDIFQEVEGE